jgi:hypothetical protein
MIKKLHLKLIKRIASNEIITELYRAIAKKDILVNTESVVRVKKGKIRYSLVVFKDKNLRTKFWISKIN